jgi:hypothetical protein
MGPSRKINSGFGGGFSLVWLVGNEISERTTYFLWDHFTGEMPANDILYHTVYYGLQSMKEEQGSSVKHKENHGCSSRD